MQLVSLNLTFPAPGFGPEKAMLYFRVETKDSWGKTENLIAPMSDLIIFASLLNQGDSGIDEAFKRIQLGKQAGIINE